ncbi:hypothetical protein [Methanoregula sp.]|uniref:hypothetical protein n=1 Tax=Methanoregula sp. TaxID=2052170 RepID=UPI0023749095|nr:hypothetical protein [Methanoregula sp.]MDD1685970.1 hypothetical protein [Methanoregula sp.]
MSPDVPIEMLMTRTSEVQAGMIRFTMGPGSSSPGGRWDSVSDVWNESLDTFENVLALAMYKIKPRTATD